MRKTEAQVLVLSDLHVGLRTPSYDSGVFRRRMQQLGQDVLRIHELHLNANDIPELHIFILGDVVEGEAVGYQVNLQDLELPLQAQVELALDEVAALVDSCTAEYSRVYIECVWGNHGRTGRFNSRTNNADLYFYTLLRERLASRPNVAVLLPSDFYQIANVMGWHYFLFHGHQVRFYSRTPLYGIENAVKDWIALRPQSFNAACVAHFHYAGKLRVAGRVPILMNGCFPTDDPHSVEMIHSDGTPTQWTFGVAEKRPIAWHYELDLLTHEERARLSEFPHE